jgi:undecaprenyl-diphosphatase
MSSDDASPRRAIRLSAAGPDAATLAAGLAALLAGIAVHRDAALDQALFHLLNGFAPGAAMAWSCLSVAGLGLSAWILLTALAPQRPQRAARFLWLLIVGGLFISAVKHRLRTPRPLAVLGDGHLDVIGEALRTQSMPSGHSATAFAVFALLVAERRRPGERAGSLAASTPGLCAAALFALGVTLSRSAVGAHWPGDLLVGAGLGLVFGALAPHAWPVAAITRFLQRPAGRRAWAAVLLLCAASIGATPALLAAAGLEGTAFAHKVATGYPMAWPLQAALALMALAGARRWWRAAGDAAGNTAGHAA